jgi:hypothetical protein
MPPETVVWIPFPSAALRPGMTPSLVITGLVPVIPIRMALRFSKRDGRDKPGHDVVGLTPAVILPIPRTGESEAREGDRPSNRASSKKPLVRGGRPIRRPVAPSRAG